MRLYYITLKEMSLVNPFVATLAEKDWYYNTSFTWILSQLFFFHHTFLPERLISVRFVYILMLELPHIIEYFSRTQLHAIFGVLVGKIYWVVDLFNYYKKPKNAFFTNMLLMNRACYFEPRGRECDYVFVGEREKFRL